MFNRAMSAPRPPLLGHILFEIDFQSQRSRGPGGQNVNKTNSSVQLRWPFRDSVVLTEDQKAVISQKLGGHISKENILHLRSDVHRDLESNKKEVLRKLEQILIQAFH